MFAVRDGGEYLSKNMKKKEDGEIKLCKGDGGDTVSSLYRSVCRRWPTVSTRRPAVSTRLPAVSKLEVEGILVIYFFKKTNRELETVLFLFLIHDLKALDTKALTLDRALII